MKYREVKAMYRSGESNLIQDFFFPCFDECTSYKRAVGFFTSTALRAWATGLTRMARTSIKLQLLIGPTLSDEDRKIILEATNDKKKLAFQNIADEFVEKATLFAEGDDNHRLWLFKSLIESKKLEIKFAFTENGQGIYHEKIGIFSFPNNDWIAFDGSLNESEHAHSKNYERINIFRSWSDHDRERGLTIIDDFDSAWNGTAKGLQVLCPSKEALEKALKSIPSEKKHTADTENDKWRHQNEAIDSFLRAGHGILEMATGTGKTKTALKIIKNLIETGQVDTVVLTMTGTDLLNQWYNEITNWQVSTDIRLPVLRHYERHTDLAAFEVIQTPKLLLISRTSLHRLSEMAESGCFRRAIIVHDEVHGLGSNENRNRLTGFHKSFSFVLGLSATPERQYDIEGTEFITAEIGDVVFKFGIEDAISRGILTEMKYVPLRYTLTDEEKKKISRLFSMKNSPNSSALSDEDIYRMIAAVYKSASSKIDVFHQYLLNFPEILDRAIIFVYDTDYGKRVMKIIDSFRHDYKGYFSGENEKYLKDFADNKIGTLVTCHRLSQGIDISDVRCVILFSSDRAKLETIQRIGRCLRVDPNNSEKHALVIDFVLDTDNENSQGRQADEERSAWLKSISEVRRNVGSN